MHHFLETNGYTVIYVDPRVTDYARKMENLGKEKSDAVDAAMLASTPWKDKKAFDRNTNVRDPLSELTRLHDSVTKNITRITNIIGSDLACIFPEFKEVFPDIGTAISLAILDQFTTPGAAVKVGMERVWNVMQKASRNHYRIEETAKLINLAKETIGIPDEYGIYTFRIRQNVARLISEKKQLKEIEEKIHKLAENNENVKRIDGIKGIGLVNAAAIVSEIGDIKQFDSALKLQS